MLQEQDVERIIGIGEDGDTPGRGQCLANQFHGLPGKFGGSATYAGEVAAGVVKTCYETGFNRVRSLHDDWNFYRDFFRRSSSRRLKGNDDVDFALDQLRCLYR